MANVLITGANRGIGLELARAYAAAGDHVFACCRDPAAAAALIDLAAGSSGRVSVHALDMADSAAIEALAASLAGRPLDILINNAGVNGGPAQTLADVDDEAWIEAMRIMVFGPLRLARALLPNLEAAAAPRVMTVSSQIGASTWPFGGYYIYASAKAAVNKVMQALALDLKGRNVIVALVHPGWVRTDMGGSGADISPQESAAGIKAVIAGLTSEDTGRFYKWNGEIHPW